MKWIGYIVILCSIMMSCQSNPTLTHEKYAYTVFQTGNFDYACYRSPAIIRANNGRLLAFAEARKNNCEDSDVDIMMRSSRDEGKTWNDPVIVWSDSTNTCGSPTPIIDRQSGHIHLVTTWRLAADSQRMIEEGTSQNTSRVYVLRSNDDGESWSYPRDITPSVKQADWSWYVTGPGSGHQITQGKYANRLIAGCTHTVVGSTISHSHVIYSDDNGSNWQLGGAISTKMTRNCEVAETSTGDLILNMHGENNRLVATSSDGGQTWGEPTADSKVMHLNAQASLHTHVLEDSRAIIFSNPNDPTEMKNMTVRVSYDDGQTWHQSLQIGKSKCANSDLVTVNDGRLGIIYEGGVHQPYEQVVYTRLPLDID